MIIASNPFFHGREEFMLNYWAAYKLECMMLEELSAYLKDFPGFARYDELCRQNITKNCELCYQKGQRLVQEGETLLLRKDTVLQEDFLDSLGLPKEAGEIRLDILSRAEDGIGGFFNLYDDVITDTGDFENMYASYFGVEDASPSPEFLEFTRNIMLPPIQIEASWFPAS